MITEENIEVMINNAEKDFLRFSSNAAEIKSITRGLEELLLIAAIEERPLWSWDSCFAYEHSFTFFDAEFTLFWDAHTAVLDSSNRGLVGFPTDYLYRAIDSSSLDHSKLPLLCNDPILVAEIPFVPGAAVVIDGNHRVATAKMLGKDVVVGHVMTYNEHVNYMTPSSAVLFKVCCNIYNSSLLLRNQMTLDEYELLCFDL